MTNGDWSFKQSREQAKKAIANLLINAEEYLKDAKLMYENKRFHHISLPIIFAIEELGSCRIILDKLKNTAEEIELNNYDGLYKHQKSIDKIRNELEISDEKKNWLQDVWKGFPFFSPVAGRVFENDEAEKMRLFAQESMSKETADKFKNLYDDELKIHLEKGAEMRIKDSFVSFDHKTGDSSLGTPMNQHYAEVRVGAVEKMIQKFRIELEGIK
ncbi:AbiV family abortive infection protein [Nitrosopumilus ureiphilus]|uniref:AbiV family abortive infection protein n=1 Tax=Nitrosopumilus ureiphilus TaxID=1470067 RepID=A0A7D5M656_9ARCH|nr:AbiV family abortive infection protein [Nitrosopumilus ureiphilus]QLH06931.1 hypothetical protein C5F50_07490 [Nitrosopumilus ureiphilus]